jgi:hypothetical protein
MLRLCRLWPRLSDPDSLKICGVFQPLHSFAGPPQALAVFPRERMERSRIESLDFLISGDGRHDRELKICSNLRVGIQDT